MAAMSAQINNPASPHPLPTTTPILAPRGHILAVTVPRRRTMLERRRHFRATAAAAARTVSWRPLAVYSECWNCCSDFGSRSEINSEFDRRSVLIGLTSRLVAEQLND